MAIKKRRVQKRKASQNKRKEALKSLRPDSSVIHYSLLIALFVVIAGIVLLSQLFPGIFNITGWATYNPTGYFGSPSSDPEPRLNGTDQTANYNGSSVSSSQTDEDSTALEQNLTQENVTIVIVSSNFDPGSVLSGNYTLGTTTGSEGGFRFNGTNNGTESKVNLKEYKKFYRKFLLGYY